MDTWKSRLTQISPGSLAAKLIIGRTNNAAVQFFRYALVGLAAAIVDTGVLLLLASVFDSRYYLAFGTVSFILGVAVNYALSIIWVFEPTRHRSAELTGFVLIGIAALGINDLVLWVCHGVLAAPLFWSKILAIILGFFWNFLMRRLLFVTLARQHTPNKAEVPVQVTK